MTQPAPTLRADTRRLTRADIIALSTGTRPWEFLPLAFAALRIAPHDHELRLHAILNLARIGLVAPARELLETLPEQVRALPDVARLTSGLPPGSPDRIEPGVLIANARAGVDAILSHPERLHAMTPDALRAALRGWEGMVGHRTWHRAAGANVVRHVVGSWNPESWTGLADTRAAARVFADKHLRFAPGEMPGPFTIEGIDPPWVLEQMLFATAPGTSSVGYRPRVSIVQADPSELLDGLAHTDLTAHLADARVELFIGPGAGAAFQRTLASRDTIINTGPCIVISGVRTRTDPPADQTIDRARAERQSAVGSLVTRAERLYADRDESWWAERYRSALSGAGEPLRVLIPTCRFSTFVQHASDDLARAFRRAGMSAEVLIEPDASSRLSATAYLGAIERLRPDLIVLINYTRAQISPHLPRNIPWVTWIQDAMPHLLNPDIGASLRPLDFLAGHIFSELVQKFGVASDRCLAIPVVADATKFHTGPVDPIDRKRLACDVAYVSHQSETPEALHDRLIRDGAVAPDLVPALERVRREIDTIVGRGLFHASSTRGNHGRIRDAVLTALRDATGQEPEPRLLSTVLRVHAMPIAERLMRHRALEWTSEICARRNWSLRLYGNGWEKHPTLSAHAAGPLAHGDELRASYQCARAHLHVSLTAPVHQRVMECALSGGLPIVRLHADGLSATHLRACMAAARRERPHRTDHADGWIGWDAIDHPTLAAYVALRQRLGMPTTDAVHFRPTWMDNLPLMDLLLPLELDPAELLVDPADVAFWDERTLEQALERSITDDTWRASRNRAIASRVRSSLTHDAFVARLTRFLAERLRAHPVAAPTAAPALAA